jgi:hypothetical protein
MKNIAVLLLGVISGCTQPAGLPPAEDCEGMGCRIPQERFTVKVDEAAAITVPIVTFFNRNGSEMIALGSADTMGSVRLQPRTSNFTSNVSLYVSARSPFVGHIDGPIDIFPVYSNPIATPTGTPILDIVSFESEPTNPPERAVCVYNDILTLDGGGNASANSYKVAGRARIRVSASSRAGHNFDITVAANATGGGLSPTGAVTPAFSARCDTYTDTGASSYNVEFSTPGLHTGSPHTIPGVSVIDYISIAFANGTATDPVSFTIQAWD